MHLLYICFFMSIPGGQIRNLETYCRTHKIPFTAFDTFDQVTATIQGLTDGSLTMAEVNRRQQLECEIEN